MGTARGTLPFGFFSDDYIIMLNKERRYWKNTLDEQALGFQKELHQKENKIRILTVENADLRADLKSKEYKNAELRRRIRNIQNRERNRSGK